MQIERLMKPDAFRSSGLNKLSSSELNSLNRWRVVCGPSHRLSKSERSALPTSASVIESRIDGEFNGWIWQQSAYHDHYHYAFGLSVLIYSSGGGYKIKVDGDSDDAVSVRRLR